MGIWRDVYIAATGPVAVRFPAVFTKLNLPANDQAELTVRCEVRNAAAHSVDGSAARQNRRHRILAARAPGAA